MDRGHQRILDAVVALYPASRARVTRVGIELECFVDPAAGRPFDWDDHVRWQARLQPLLSSRAPTVGSLGLEPGGQWELRSVALDGREGLRTFGHDAACLQRLLRDQGCRAVFQGVRPHGPRARVISPERRTALLGDYLHRRSGAAAEMMADTASCQMTFDALSLADVWELLRVVVRRQDELQRRWNPSGRERSRRAVWAEVDPERCVPPRGMIDGSWSDEACLDHVLSIPCIVVAGADGGLVPFEGSFYDAVAAFPAPAGIAVRFTQFIKHIYYPVKPRVMAELRWLDSRPPDRLAELHDLLADLGLPGWCSADRRALGCSAARA